MFVEEAVEVGGIQKVLAQVGPAGAVVELDTRHCEVAVERPKVVLETMVWVRQRRFGLFYQLLL